MDTAIEFRRDQVVWVLDPADYGPSHRFPGEWKIEKVNQRTVKLIQNGRRLNCDKTLISTTPPPEDAALSIADLRIPWQQGTVVRWESAPPKAGGPGLFIVIDDKGERTLGRIVRIGGGGGRYWRKVPAAALTEVSPDDIKVL